VPAVLIITHLDDHQPGVVREQLELSGCEVLEANALDGSPLPTVGEISAIVSLGGEMSATTYRDDPFLSAEVELLRAALEERTPVIGMCLGAQLLAVAAGGRVSTLDDVYVGWPELSSLPAASDDLLFAGLTPQLPVLKWHEDVIEPPPEAVMLGTTPSPGAALFRVGRAAWGSQAHLEVDEPMVLDGWLAEPRGIAQVQAAGHELERFRAESRERLPGQMAAARPVFSAFAELAISYGPGSSASS
jgi:GMP synthase-like glutamine amidotransferase